MSENHLSDHDLERYYLGMVTQEEELAQLQEHLLCCLSCVERAEATQGYVDILRRGLLVVNYPEESLSRDVQIRPRDSMDCQPRNPGSQSVQ